MAADSGNLNVAEQSALPTPEAILPEDVLRADMYDLLAALLARPPAAPVLAAVSRLEGNETDLGQAVDMLARLAGGATAADAKREFNALFVGLGRGEVLPFASYYTTGFLNEAPLARLRTDMAQLGILREDGVSEPEDNLASLCDMMAGLIRGRFGAPVPLARQREFFDTHLAPWAGLCFQDIEQAQSAVIYAAVGAMGREFITIEAETLRMVE